MGFGDCGRRVQLLAFGFRARGLGLRCGIPKLVSAATLTGPVQPLALCGIWFQARERVEISEFTSAGERKNAVLAACLVLLSGVRVEVLRVLGIRGFGYQRRSG